MNEGILQVYYGEGAGKSSAAIGHAIRRANAGGTVYLIRFLKEQFLNDFISRLEPEIKFFRFERSNRAYGDMSDEQRNEERKNITNGINYARKVMSTGECDLLVLDEVLGAVEEGALEEEELCEVLSHRPQSMTVILTGYHLPPAIAEMADSILNIQKEK